nr:MAG TPA: hypothetical protein [Microviridae sp.]
MEPNLKLIAQKIKNEIIKENNLYKDKEEPIEVTLMLVLLTNSGIEIYNKIITILAPKHLLLKMQRKRFIRETIDEKMNEIKKDIQKNSSNLIEWNYFLI